MKIRSLYKYGPRTEPLSFKTVDEKGNVLSGRTKQAFKEECDINGILRKFNKTGQLPEMIKKNPQYGDFSEAPQYQEALNLVLAAEQQFAALPARARERFHNSPKEFLEFANNAANADEMAKMGLIKPEAIERVQKAKESKKSTKKDPAPEGSDK